MNQAAALARLEELAARRAEMERDQGDPRWWWDDPEYQAIAWEMINIKASLGRPFGEMGKKKAKR